MGAFIHLDQVTWLFSSIVPSMASGKPVQCRFSAAAELMPFILPPNCLQEWYHIQCHFKASEPSIILNLIKIPVFFSLHFIGKVKLLKEPDVVPGAGSWPRNWSKNQTYRLFLLITSTPKELRKTAFLGMESSKLTVPKL